MKIYLLFCFFILSENSFSQNIISDKGLKAFDAKNFKVALAKLKPYADKGNCLAEYIVGFSYLYGDSDIKNDSLARHWLQLSADQKYPQAMGPLASSYFGSTVIDANIKAYLWAVLAAEYDPKQKYTTTRVLIKMYLKPGELEHADKLIAEYEKNWKNQDACK